MASKTFFYGRISTRTQHDDRQRDMADNLNIPDNCRFFETANGSNRNRKELNRLLEVVREDDTVYCESLSRISRDLTSMVEICHLLNDKGVKLVSLKENEIDCNTPNGRLLLGIYASLAQWEKEMRAERCREGQQARRNQGKTCGGRKPIDETKMMGAVSLWQTGEMSINEICSATGVNKSSFYRYIKDKGISRD